MRDLSIEPSIRLIKQYAGIPDNAKVLLLSAESSRLIRYLAERASEVAVFDISHAAITQARAIPLPGVRYNESVFPNEGDHYDVALMLIPKGRDLARAWVWRAYQALRPGSEMLVVGPNNGGIKSIIADMAMIFGQSRTIAYKHSHRIGGAVKQTAGIVPFPVPWGDDPTRMQQRQYATPLGVLNVSTMPGIFSWDHLDEGTSFLLEQPVLTDYANKARVLDVGCGGGVIGILLAPYASEIVLADDNWLAVRCSEHTVRLGGYDNVRVLPSDVYSDLEGQSFDLIVSNPPFHRQFDTATDIAARIIREAPQHLKPGGCLMLVCNSFLPYHKLIAGCFKSVHTLADNGLFKVLVGQ